jgi:hypothetical protein
MQGGVHACLSLPDAAAPSLALGADLLRSMLAYRAADRITAAQALQHTFFQLQL